MAQIRLVGAAQGAVSGDAGLRIGGGELFFHQGDAGRAEVGEEEDRAGADEGVGVGEESGDGRNRGGTLSLERDEAGGAHINRGVFQCCDLAGSGREIELWHDGLEPLRRDAIDGTDSLGIKVGVAADARVKPVGNVDRSVGSHGDIGGAEERFQLGVDRLHAALEVDAGEFLFLI